MFIRHGEAVLHVRLDGPAGGAPLLLLHGLAGDLRMWDPQAEALSATWRVIRFDLRGQGLSQGGVEGVTLAGLADDAAAVLDALGVGQAHVGGISLGGRVALEFAARAPDRVLSLMPCNTALSFGAPEAWDQRIASARAAGMEANADAALGRWVADKASPGSRALRRMIVTGPVDGYAAGAAILRDARPDSISGRITARTTVIFGEADVATPLKDSESIRDAIPGAKLVTIPGAAHVPNFEYAEELTAAMRAHLEG
ncbi:alpha/beta fold hydrolase [Roseomonas sp. 18066]|uniref:alpha/beta fold hydrolase n=1 Tax=Roseomonas sp. 18066 TaxID=2681412 RepID=UPI001357AF41|nr:alpha/beta fold hydrolase [Roseomonas sp. 18066]